MTAMSCSATCSAAQALLHVQDWTPRHRCKRPQCFKALLPEINPCLCTACTRKRFYDSSELFRHMESQHEHCFMCRREHPDKYVYYRHYQELQGELQPPACPQCQ